MTDSSSGPAPRRSAASTARGRHVGGDDQGHVLLGHRVGRDWPPRRRGGAPRSAPSRSISAAAVRAGSPYAATTFGCSSPAYPITVPSDGGELRTPARDARARCSTARPARVTPDRGGRDVDERRSPAASRPPHRTRPAGGPLSRSARRPDVAAAVRSAASSAASSSSTVAAVTGGRGADRRFVGEEHRAGLVQSARSSMPRLRLRATAAEDPGQQRGAHVRAGLRQRVDDPVQPAALVVRRQPEPVELAAPTNGKLRISTNPAAASAALTARRARWPRSARDPPAPAARSAGDGVVADQPADLLDVVVRVGQVGSPARRGDRQRSMTADVRADRGDQRDGGVVIDIGAEDARRAGRRRSWWWPAVAARRRRSRPRHERPAGSSTSNWATRWAAA